MMHTQHEEGTVRMRADLELRDFARKLDKKLIYESANVGAAVIGEGLLCRSWGPHLKSKCEGKTTWYSV